MVSDSKMLTSEEFASLAKVGHTGAVCEPPAVIPAEHNAKLIALVTRPISQQAPGDYYRKVEDNGRSTATTDELRRP